MRLRRGLFILLGFLLITCSDNIKVTENDHTIIVLNKKDNKNKVIYAVKTNGKCAITDIFPYWKMDQTDGHTEDLLSIEEGVYGVKDVKKINDALWIFDIAEKPEKKIEARAKTDVTANGSVANCSFEARSDINGVSSILKGIMVNNNGTNVSSIEYIGNRVTDGTAIHETVYD